MAQVLPNPVVPVSVTVTTKDDGTVDIQCSPNPVPVDALHSLISFSLDTKGWRFRTTNAVQLDEPDPDVPFPSWTIAPDQCMLFDLCQTNVTLKYTVNVVNVLNDAEYSVDPEIKNGDGGPSGTGGNP